MGFTRQRKQSDFIIKSKKNIILELLTILTTMVMWIYSILVVYLFGSALLNHNDKYISTIKIALKVNNQEIRNFMLLSIILFVISFIILFAWRTYNKKQYGNLNRRKPPIPTTDEDMLKLNLMQKDDYLYLKNNKKVVFYSNPIREIYEEDECYEKENSAI